MIHDEIVTYKVAKLAKEKGFNTYVDAFYAEDCDAAHFQGPEKWNEYNGRFAAPTQSLLQRWLREEKGIAICVDIYDDGWFFDIATFHQQDAGVYEMIDIPYKSSNVTPDYSTYELALEDALKYALENLV